jgi:hypothetical protein
MVTKTQIIICCYFFSIILNYSKLFVITLPVVDLEEGKRRGLFCVLIFGSLDG